MRGYTPSLSATLSRITSGGRGSVSGSHSSTGSVQPVLRSARIATSAGTRYSILPPSIAMPRPANALPPAGGAPKRSLKRPHCARSVSMCCGWKRKPFSTKSSVRLRGPGGSTMVSSAVTLPRTAAHHASTGAVRDFGRGRRGIMGPDAGGL